jgi:hypothetical protein
MRYPDLGGFAGSETLEQLRYPEGRVPDVVEIRLARKRSPACVYIFHRRGQTDRQLPAQLHVGLSLAVGLTPGRPDRERWRASCRGTPPVMHRWRVEGRIVSTDRGEYRKLPHA